MLCGDRISDIFDSSSRQCGQSLKAITINPITNVEPIAFKEADTRAVMGEDYASGTPLALSSIGEQDPTNKSTTLVFNQPIKPGNTVTVRLKVEKNPLYGGIYLLKVTAFPDNQHSQGLPLVMSVSIF